MKEQVLLIETLFERTAHYTKTTAELYKLKAIEKWPLVFLRKILFRSSLLKGGLTIQVQTDSFNFIDHLLCKIAK